MSDQNFHEIQLSGKQLVFLFMCAVVVTVAVFLLGVSVGREVRPVSTPTSGPSSPAPSSAGDTVVPADTPPPTQTASGDLSYAQVLQGKEGEDPSKVAPPAPAPEEPPATAPQKTAPAATPPPPPQKADASPVVGAAAKAPSAPPTPDAKAAPAVAGWQVQIGAFNTTDVAAKAVAKLQAQGYPAFVFTEPANTPGPRYKVRVGPYSARAEADETLKKLSKEGYTPLIKR